MKFKRRSNMVRHYKFIHEMCIRKYSKSREELELHHCDQCDFKTIYKENLKSHIGMVHSIKQKPFFNCEQCSFKTTYKRNLTSHAKTHENNADKKTIHKCDTCEFASLYERSLTRHKKEKHPKE